ncbi:MAG TPA: AI-2E family transporter [Anaerolineae bacterium]|nr:AI-2E family transporter [Anaerolineae bacterium]
MNPRQAFPITVVVLATLALAYLLIQVGEIVLVLFIAIVFASALRPLVNALTDRGLPRGLVILAFYLIILVALLALVLVSIPPLVSLVLDFFEGDTLRTELERFTRWLAFFGWDNFRIIPPVFALPDTVMQLLDRAESTVEREALPAVQGAGLVLGYFVLVFVMGFYWLTAREQLLDLLLRLSPLRHRAKVEEVWTDVETTLGSYLRGQVILMASVGLASFIGLTIFGVPYAAALAVVAGLTEIIPIVGPFLGAIPAIILALTISGPTALLVAVWYIAVQQLEAHILVPRVMGRATGLSPLLVIVALLAGGMLNGVIGALIALPLAGAVQVIVRHLIIDPTVQKRAPQREEGGVLLADTEEDEENGALAESTRVIVREGQNRAPEH